MRSSVFLLALMSLNLLIGCSGKNSYSSQYREKVYQTDRGSQYDENTYEPDQGNPYDEGTGHDAGYQWAEDNGVEDPDDCDGNSDSFIEGCQTYAEEQQDNNATDDSDHDYGS